MIGRWAPENEFQSTHPHGVRLHNPKLSLSIVRFQSTHPHGVRRSPSLSPRIRIRVSIHAPTRGATVMPFLCLWNLQVSIHAPTRGATPASIVSDRIGRGFNPRTHTGCDEAEINNCTLIFVSIHAPTRGATPSGTCVNVVLISFNPRTHTGCDLPRSCNTPAYGCFNPRTHTGCDCIAYSPNTEMVRFQSTHPHGVRQGRQ